MPPATQTQENASQSLEHVAQEAILDQLVQADNPHQWLDAITGYDVPQEHRAALLPTFFAMIATRSPSEEDQLIALGRPVFLYRQDTARKAVAALRAERADRVVISPSVATDAFLAEAIFDPSSRPPVRYLVYRGAGEPEVQDNVAYDGVIYSPPQTRLVDSGTVLLPSGVEEYDSVIDLLARIRHFISSYLYLESREFRTMVAAYVMLSWIYDKFDVVPYLRVQGTFGVGKSRFLQVVGSLCNRAIYAGGATTAAPIFRIMERFHGVLVLDEADFRGSDIENEVTKVLTVGYLRGFPVLRAERNKDDGFDVMGYDCYGPKILATRKRFEDDALESRCLTYFMQARAVPSQVPFYLGAEFRAEALSLRNQLLYWRFRTWRDIEADPRMRIPDTDPRLNQILLPLLACVRDQPAVAAAILAHAQSYQASMRDTRRESFEGRIAYHVLRRWGHRRVEDRVLMNEVLDALRREYETQPRILATIDARRIGTKIRSDLGLQVQYREGQNWILLSSAEVSRIARHYSIGEEQYRPAGTTPPGGSPGGRTPRQAVVP